MKRKREYRWKSDLETNQRKRRKYDSSDSSVICIETDDHSESDSSDVVCLGSSHEDSNFDDDVIIVTPRKKAKKKHRTPNPFLPIVSKNLFSSCFFEEDNEIKEDDNEEEEFAVSRPSLGNDFELTKKQIRDDLSLYLEENLDFDEEENKPDELHVQFLDFVLPMKTTNRFLRDDSLQKKRRGRKKGNIIGNIEDHLEIEEIIAGKIDDSIFFCLEIQKLIRNIQSMTNSYLVVPKSIQSYILMLIRRFPKVKNETDHGQVSNEIKILEKRKKNLMNEVLQELICVFHNIQNFITFEGKRKKLDVENYPLISIGELQDGLAKAHKFLGARKYVELVSNLVAKQEEINFENQTEKLIFRLIPRFTKKTIRQLKQLIESLFNAFKKTYKKGFLETSKAICKILDIILINFDISKQDQSILVEYSTWFFDLENTQITFFLDNIAKKLELIDYCLFRFYGKTNSITINNLYANISYFEKKINFFSDSFETEKFFHYIHYYLNHLKERNYFRNKIGVQKIIVDEVDILYFTILKKKPGILSNSLDLINKIKHLFAEIDLPKNCFDQENWLFTCNSPINI